MIKQENVITKLLVRVKKSFKKTCSCKTPGNDGLPRKIMKHFQETLENLSSMLLINLWSNQKKISKKWANSQWQAVIKLIEKRDKNKRYKDKRIIKNWRPILLNLNYETRLEVFSARLKDVLPNLCGKRVHRRIRQAFFRYSWCNWET